MTEYRTITVKVIALERIHKESDAYADIERLDVQDTGGQRFKLTRFRRANEYKMVEGYWYTGQQKPATNDKYNDVFMNVEYLDGGADGVTSPLWPEPDEKEIDARQKSILVQSDMRTAAILVQHESADIKWEDFAHYYQRIKQFREAEEKK